MLSEEAEQEERDDRDKLREVRERLRALLDRRRAQFDEVRRLSDEQKRLHDERQPGEMEVERLHEEFRTLGHDLSEIRRRRDEARSRLDQSIADLREFRSRTPRGEPPRPETIRREIAELEHAQQTRTLSLAEENALIKRLRQLVQQAEEAGRTQAAHEELKRARASHEAAVDERRRELAAAQGELARLHDERSRRMQAIRARLEGAGQLVAGIREKARARAAAMEKLRALSAQVDALMREADGLVANSRRRRDEARQAIVEYRRSVQGPAGPRSAEQQVADRQLDELLKRGRVTLRG